MITFLMAFRASSDKNIEAMKKLFHTIETYLPSSEILIKLDEDDNKGIDFIKRENKGYVKYFIFHRWEGRWSINYFYDYLFTRRDPTFKYVMMITDDTVITRDFTKDLDDKHYLFGNYQEEMTKYKLIKVGNIANHQGLTSNYICAYPVINAKLIEITGNFGYQANPDSHFALLNIIAYQKHGIILAKHIPDFIERFNIDRTNHYGEIFGKDNLVSDSDMLTNPYIFKLIEQQAKNIYLNGKKYD